MAYSKKTIAAAKKLHREYKNLDEDYIKSLKFKVEMSAVNATIRTPLPGGDVLEQKLTDDECAAMLELAKTLGCYLNLRRKGELK